MPSVTVIASIDIYDFLVTAQTPKAMDEFCSVMKNSYDIKKIGSIARHLGWHCHFYGDCTIALSQRLEVDKKVSHANMVG